MGLQTSTLVAVLLTLWMSVGSLGPVAVGQERQRVEIDLRQRHQEIEGFGASGAWWPNVLDGFSREQQQEMLELLFSPAGAHLSIYRYNIPAGSGEDVLRPERRTVNIETGPFEYDLSRDAKALGFLERVRKLGVSRFVLFANSPPARMTRNGKPSGGENGGSNLKPESVEDFAQYLVEVTALIKKQYDLPMVTLSPINEPQWRWGQKWRGQEGCHYTPKEIVPVYRAVIEKLKATDPTVRIEGPESGDWKSAMAFADAIYTDPVLEKEFDLFGIHSYWSNAEHKRKFMAEFSRKYPGRRIAMTEYCEMKHGQDMTMGAGLRLARVIHDDLTIGRVVSWQWWLAIAPGGYEDGLVYANTEKKAIEVSHRLWVMGQWSRFVRPGARRVEVAAPDPLCATAFVSEDEASVACVVINDTDRAIDAAVVVPAFEGKSVRHFVSDATRKIERVQGEAGFTRFPARSVSTVVFSKD